jgi:hypothetical protein
MSTIFATENSQGTSILIIRMSRDTHDRPRIGQIKQSLMKLGATCSVINVTLGDYLRKREL